MIRSTLFGLALASITFFAAGCTGASDTPETGSPPAPSSSMPSNGSGSGANGGTSGGGQTDATEPGTQDPAAPGDDSATPTDPSGKPTGGKPGADEPPAPADPACVASCTTSMKTKCQGDDTFCSDVCSGMTTAQVACIGAAPSCDKPEWIRCIDENPGK